MIRLRDYGGQHHFRPLNSKILKTEISKEAKQHVVQNDDQIFVILVGLDNKQSFKSAKEVWVKMISQVHSECGLKLNRKSIFVVGNKLDKYEDDPKNANYVDPKSLKRISKHAYVVSCYRSVIFKSEEYAFQSWENIKENLLNLQKTNSPKFIHILIYLRPISSIPIKF